MQKITAQELLTRYANGERDFSAVDLSGIDLFERDLQELNLQASQLDRAYLAYVNLSQPSWWRSRWAMRVYQWQT